MKELVEMHKATISVDSRLGEGSCFKVDFLKGKEHYDKETEFILEDAEAQMCIRDSRRTSSCLLCVCRSCLF